MSDEPLKVLNLYAGIGGNRKLWEEVEDVDVTAVEIEPEIAEVYQDNFPQDDVLVEDAHDYLINHFNDGWDFIWTSPPCPTHTRYNLTRIGNVGGYDLDGLSYPDMRLYQEIIILDSFFNGKYCVENVQAYYDPLIKPQKIQRHYFWTNFNILSKKMEYDNRRDATQKDLEERYGLDLSSYSGSSRTKILRNCVSPKVSKHILKCAVEKEIGDLEAFI